MRLPPCHHTRSVYSHSVSQALLCWHVFAFCLCLFSLVFFFVCLVLFLLSIIVQTVNFGFLDLFRVHNPSKRPCSCCVICLSSLRGREGHTSSSSCNSSLTHSFLFSILHSPPRWELWAKIHVCAAPAALLIHSSSFALLLPPSLFYFILLPSSPTLVFLLLFFSVYLPSIRLLFVLHFLFSDGFRPACPGPLHAEMVRFFCFALCDDAVPDPRTHARCGLRPKCINIALEIFRQSQKQKRGSREEKGRKDERKESHRSTC